MKLKLDMVMGADNFREKNTFLQHYRLLTYESVDSDF